MKKVLNIILIVTGVTMVISVGLFVSYVFDSEEILKLQLSNETDIIFPDNYLVTRSTGHLRKDSIHYEFKFDDSALQQLISSIQKTPFFNDTLALKELIQLKWDPDDPRQIWKMKGLWLENDTAFLFLDAPQVYSGAPTRHIIEAMVDKRTKTLRTTMAP